VESVGHPSNTWRVWVTLVIHGDRLHTRPLAHVSDALSHIGLITYH